MGGANRGRDAKLNRDVAIKVLPESVSNDQNGTHASAVRRRCSRR